MSSNNNINEINEILERTNNYIVRLARQNLPRATSSKETLEMDIDDLAQDIRIKLWHALERIQIIRLHAYIRSIAQTGAIDKIRRYRATAPLPLDDDGELYQGEIISQQKEGFADPAMQWEEKEDLIEKTVQVAQMIQSLPPRQQYASLCAIKESIDYLPPIIIDIFLLHGLDIQQAKWSDDKQEVQRLHASLAIARKKLGQFKLDQRR
jgi:RNA polymerase sigma factor (sigma-70 family)